MTTGTIRWHYLADGEMPDDEIAVLACIAEDEGCAFVAEVAHDGDRGWIWSGSGEPLGPDYEVYAWASDPDPIAYRSPNSQRKAVA